MIYNYFVYNNGVHMHNTCCKYLHRHSITTYGERRVNFKDIQQWNIPA